MFKATLREIADFRPSETLDQTHILGASLQNKVQFFSINQKIWLTWKWKVFLCKWPLRIKVYFIKLVALWLKNWTLFSKLAPKICVWSNVSLGRKSAISLKVALNTSGAVLSKNMGPKPWHNFKYFSWFKPPCILTLFWYSWSLQINESKIGLFMVNRSEN